MKILGNGEMTKKLTVVAGWYSKSAHEKITKAGGTAQNLKGEAFEFPKPKKKFIPREAGEGRRRRAARKAKKGSRRSRRGRGRRAAESRGEAKSAQRKPAEGVAIACCPDARCGKRRRQRDNGHLFSRIITIMFKTLINIFRVPELRNKVLFTLFMLDDLSHRLSRAAPGRRSDPV